MSRNMEKCEKNFLVYRPGIEQILSTKRSRPPKNQQNLIKIYDVPMKFASKLIHGGPVHLCHRPL